MLKKYMGSKKLDYVILEQYQGEIFISHPKKDFVLEKGYKMLCLGKVAKFDIKTKQVMEVTIAKKSKHFIDRVQTIMKVKNTKKSANKVREISNAVKERLSLLHII